MSRAAILLCLCLAASCAAGAERPNIVLIVADDLGYSDIGAFGGEIRTPNLDALVRGGRLLTNFHAGASCSPTRSMLLSGTDHHLAGVGLQGSGNYPEVRGRPGYEDALNERVAPLAELLRDAGYHTYITGKWHLGMQAGQRPNARGFERSFVTADGGASHFSDRKGLLLEDAIYWQDDREIDRLPEDFYSTTHHTDAMIEFIRAGAGDGRPFFSYLAYTSPHWPLQVPDDWLDRYRGAYDQGWDAVREARLARMRELGLLGPGQTAFGRPAWVSPWESLGPLARQVEARRMELYAAMVENLDHHIGRFVAYLRESGRYDNTFILFIADNGAEGNDIGRLGNNAYYVPARFDNRLENMGRIGSYVWQGRGWAHVSQAPFRMFKSFASQGAFRVPAIASWPARIPAGGRSDAMLTVMDVLPTALELAGMAHPGTHYKGRSVYPPRGRSMAAHLTAAAPAVHAPDAGFGWESYGNRAYRRGDWRILWQWPPYGPGRWELFNVASDPGETRDLSGEHPEILAELAAAWDAYAADTGIYVFDRDAGYGR